MAFINILDHSTIDQIAAGEVVERPSSIVKELVENAMDAGGSAITVEIKDGGISFIRVTDNGCGIEKSEIRKAFMRHATSKMSHAEDLTHLMSLGFRGEALSSISAVSQVEMITKTRNDLTGIRVLMEGSEETSFEEIGAPDGTTIMVRNVFFNVPARKKFLKTPQTEGSYIGDLMEHLALSNPHISFKFMQNGQTRFSTSGNGSLKEVIYRIYGRDVTDAMVEITQESQDIRLYGFLGKPSNNRSNRNFEIYFINHRFIRSRLIAKALEEGYHNYLMQHKYPFCVLMIDIDPEQVDVNVHPTKMDVRFANSTHVYDFLESSIRACLHVQEMIPPVLLEEEAAHQQEIYKEAVPEPFQEKARAIFEQREHAIPSFIPTILKADSVQTPSAKAEMKTDRGHLETFHFSDEEDEENETADAMRELAIREKEAEKEREAVSDAIEAETEREAVSDAGEEAENSVEASEIWKKAESRTGQEENQNAKVHDQMVYGQPLHDKNVIKAAPIAMKAVQMELYEPKILTPQSRKKFQIMGQIFDTYWLVLFEDKLLMVDQHAAHEKVKYEKLMKQYREGEMLSQNLYPPVVISLSAKEQTTLEEYQDKFAALGFETDSFGGNEISVRTAPLDLYGASIKELFLEVLDGIDETGMEKYPSVEAKIASMACKAAVKGNNRLSTPEMESLLDQLLTLENPYFCPHGRPTMISFSQYEIEKKFKRIV